MTALKTACRQLGLQKWPSGKWLPSDFDEQVVSSNSPTERTVDTSAHDHECQSTVGLSRPTVSNFGSVLEEKNCTWSSGERKVFGLSTALLLDEALCHVQSSFPIQAKSALL